MVYKNTSYILTYAQTYKTYRPATVHKMYPATGKYVYYTRTYNILNVSSDSF